MAVVYLSLGSNIEREKNIQRCMVMLKKEFNVVNASIVYESESVGFKSDNFLNSVVQIETALLVNELSKKLRDIELAHGRDRLSPKFSARKLDIDILTYDQQVGEFGKVILPREEILYNAFVLKPLADIAPKELHPLMRVSYQNLWAQFNQASQKLWPALFQPK